MSVIQRKGAKMNDLEYMYKVSEFAESRGIKRDTVTTFIRRNPGSFLGHTEQKTDGMYFDEVAMQVLDKKYPLPQPVEVIKDTRSLELLVAEQAKTSKLQTELMELQKQMNEVQLKLTKAESEKLLLEDKTERYAAEEKELREKLENQSQELKEKSEGLIETRTKLDYVEQEKERERERAEAAEAELERAKKATLWQRITGKW